MAESFQSPASYPGARVAAQDTNRVLRNTYWLLALSMTRIIVKPVLALAEGAERVRSGDLTVQLPITSEDELGILTGGFNSMVSTIHEKTDVCVHVITECQKYLGRDVDAHTIHCFPVDALGDLVHVLQGHPSQEILALAVRQDVSLIMISSQGKSWSRQIRVGSTAFDVVRQAESPVLVVRPGKK